MALVAAVAAKRAADVDALLASGRVDLRQVSDGALRMLAVKAGDLTGGAGLRVLCVLTEQMGAGAHSYLKHVPASMLAIAALATHDDRVRRIIGASLRHRML